jgi:DNA-binding winged helix-turn-helix (wHTH) protein
MIEHIVGEQLESRTARAYTRPPARIGAFDFSMTMPAPTAGRVRFGPYEADLITGELRKHGRKLRVTGRPFQILAALLERPGELVTREELQAKLWPADTFVDFEHGVNSAILTLRRALCDSHQKPTYIETLPRRGYRFIGVIESAPCEAQTQAGAVETPSSRESAETDEWVGNTAILVGEAGANFLLIPRDASALEEQQRCEAAKDDLGITLLAGDQRLLLVECGTKVKILEARAGDAGCSVRILGGTFIGETAFAPRKYLQLVSAAEP